jgi:hypothetical protein
LKNNTLRKREAHAERTRRKRERKQAARARKPQTAAAARPGNIVTVDFSNRRPAIKSKSNVRYGNPRPYTGAKAA